MPSSICCLWVHCVHDVEEIRSLQLQACAGNCPQACAGLITAKTGTFVFGTLCSLITSPFAFWGCNNDCRGSAASHMLFANIDPLPNKQSAADQATPLMIALSGLLHITQLHVLQNIAAYVVMTRLPAGSDLR